MASNNRKLSEHSAHSNSQWILSHDSGEVKEDIIAEKDTCEEIRFEEPGYALTLRQRLNFQQLSCALCGISSALSGSPIPFDESRLYLKQFYKIVSNRVIEQKRHYGFEHSIKLETGSGLRVIKI